MEGSINARLSLFESEEWRFIDGSLSEIGDKSIRGHADIISLSKGIAGWAVDLDDPDRELGIELILDNVVISECSTGDFRKDIATILQTSVNAGFRFPSSTIADLRDLLITCGHCAVLFRVKHTELYLPSSKGVPSLSELFSDELIEEQNDRIGFDLTERLATHRIQAIQAAKRPLRPVPASQIGVIEAIAIDEMGLTWIVGWMRRTDYVDCAGVIVDKNKVPAGFAFTLFDRADLTEQNVGIFGALLTDWRPTLNSEFFLYLPDEGQRYLKALAPLQLVSKSSFTDHFARLKGSCHTGHTLNLTKLLSTTDPWICNDANGSGVHATVDQCFVLPTFGCFVSGWAISPIKQIFRLVLKIGSAVLPCDPSSLSFKPRPDLNSAFPGYGKVVEKSGFVGLFRGRIALDHLAEAVLKLVFTDGTFSNHAVDHRVARRLGHAVPFEAVYDLFPTIESEAFFPDLVLALKDEERLLAGSCHPYSLKESSNAIILFAPTHRSELFLFFENLLRSKQELQGPVGIYIVADTNRNRSDTLYLFKELNKRLSVSCNLIFVDDADNAFLLLPNILAMSRANNFVSIDSGIFPTRLGWKSVIRAVTQASDHIKLFEIEDPESIQEHGHVSEEFFAWRAVRFAIWMKDRQVAQTRIRNYNFGHLLVSVAEIVPEAAIRTVIKYPSRLIAAASAFQSVQDARS